MEEYKEYYADGGFIDLLKRSFLLSKRAFNVSYITKLLSLILSVVVNILAYKLIEFILREIDIDPTLLSFLIIGIILITAYLIIIINTFSDVTIYHSLCGASLGKSFGIDSLKYTFKRIRQWALISLIILFIQFLYVVIISLLMQYIGEEAVIIAKWIFIIIGFCITPILYLIIPFMIMEKLNFIEAFRRSIKIGRKYYGKAFIVNAFILIMFYVVRYLFTLIFEAIPLNYTLLFNFITQIKNGFYLISSEPSYYIVLMIYLCVISSLSVVMSGLRISMMASFMSNEYTSEKAYLKVSDSI